MSSGTIETTEDLAGFADMDADQRSAYVDSLREKVADSHPEPNGRAKEELPPPGKTRDEMGRYKPAETKTPETPASDDETPVAADAVPAAKPEEDEVRASDWLTPEVSEQASAYGLTPDDLSEFGSRDELDRALRIIDRKAFAAGKSGAAPEPAKPLAATPATEGATQQATNDALAQLEAFSLDDQLGADDAPKIRDAVKAITAELKEMRQFRGQLQQRDAQSAFSRIKTDFAASVDSLGHTELFGKPGERTKEQAANMEKVFADGHLPHARGLLAQGRQVAPNAAFAKAAVNLLFGDQLIDQAKQQQLTRLKKQSAKRTGGGSAKTLPLPSNATPLERNLREASENWRRAHGDD